MTTAHIPYQELENAHRLAAKAVKLHGRVYLPLFQRLDKELKARNSDDDDLMRALEIADRAA